MRGAVLRACDYVGKRRERSDLLQRNGSVEPERSMPSARTIFQSNEQLGKFVLFEVTYLSLHLPTDQTIDARWRGDFFDEIVPGLEAFGLDANPVGEGPPEMDIPKQACASPCSDETSVGVGLCESCFFSSHDGTQDTAQASYASARSSPGEAVAPSSLDLLRCE